MKDHTTIHDFRVMKFDDKANFVTYKTNYIMHRTLNECKVFLYYANGFFIEVYFSVIRQKVLFINAFEGVSGLEPHLENISINEILTA